MDSRLHWSGARRLGAFQNFLFDIVIVLTVNESLPSYRVRLQPVTSSASRQKYESRNYQCPEEVARVLGTLARIRMTVALMR